MAFWTSWILYAHGIQYIHAGKHSYTWNKNIKKKNTSQAKWASDLITYASKSTQTLSPRQLYYGELLTSSQRKSGPKASLLNFFHCWRQGFSVYPWLSWTHSVVRTASDCLKLKDLHHHHHPAEFAYCLQEVLIPTPYRERSCLKQTFEGQAWSTG